VNHFPLTAIGSWRDGVQVYGTASADTICSRCDERFTAPAPVVRVATMTPCGHAADVNPAPAPLGRHATAS
jgi:hypothetical protein